MADSVLFISWGAPVTGREERGLEVFNDALGYYGRLQQEARIERFDVALIMGNPRIGGYMVLHGSHAQLDATRQDGEFRDILSAAALVVRDLDVSEGVTDAGIAPEMERYQQQIARVAAPM
jgi:hypothetical protein